MKKSDFTKRDIKKKFNGKIIHAFGIWKVFVS